MEIFANVDTASHSLYSWDSITDQWTRVTKDTRLDPLTAVWIYAVKPAGVTLPIATAGPEGNLTRSLSTGWNLMSLPGTNLTSSDTILRDQDWSYILGFNTQSQQYDTPVQKENESGQLLDPKQGYWLYMGNPGTLVTPAI